MLLLSTPPLILEEKLEKEIKIILLKIILLKIILLKID